MAYSIKIKRVATQDDGDDGEKDSQTICKIKIGSFIHVNCFAEGCSNICGNPFAADRIISTSRHLRWAYLHD